MEMNQLEKKIEEVATPILLQDRRDRIIKNFHLIIFKFIIICATVAIVASFVYARITRKGSTELADVLLMFLLLILFLFVLVLKSPKVRKSFSKEIYKGSDD
jgi:predicted PurR-regulated permease PerM